MPKHLLAASATLALLIVSGCGGGTTATSSPAAASATPASKCANGSAAHRAFVVVQHGSGMVVERCVGFGTASLNGDDLMKQSGLPIQTQSFSGIGTAYCSIDNEPAQFDKCFPSSGPTWSLYVAKAGAQFQAAQTAASGVTLGDGDALGWRYQVFSPSPNPPPTPTLK